MADLRGTLEVVRPGRRRARRRPVRRAAPTRSRRGPRQQLTEGHRYEELINRTQWWGRQMLIWGVHVHVGLPEQERVMPVLSVAAQPLPAPAGALGVLADLGRGRHRLRLQPGADVPAAADRRAAVPVRDLGGVRGASPATSSSPGVIDELSEIRWDVRPAPHLGTLENRVCDGVVRPSTTSPALVALMHCLVVDLDTRLAAGEKLPTMPPWHVQENKWRAARYGLDAIVILDAALERAADHRRPRRPARAAGPGGRPARLRGRAGPVAEIPRRGASYQRQRAVADAHRRRPGRGGRLGRPRAARGPGAGLADVGLVGSSGLAGVVGVGHLEPHAEQPHRPVPLDPVEQRDRRVGQRRRGRWSAPAG